MADHPHTDVSVPLAKSWRGPTIRTIAEATGLGTATVDRVINNRAGVREATRIKVMEALAALGETPNTSRLRAPKITFFSDSGASFNRSLEEAMMTYASAHPEVSCTFQGIETDAVDPLELARSIEAAGETADGLVIVAREALAINRAVRSVIARGVPVVCATTDLPTSDRMAYVGSDQTSAGATAAYLMGRFLGGTTGKILLVISASYRSQEERELGFRRVLRAEFPNLEVQERVNSNDSQEYSYRNVRDYVRKNGAPVGIYNVAGGNLGVARALRDTGLQGSIVFIGHELNTNSRMLLESSEMDVVVGHDLDQEVALSIDAITSYLRQGSVPIINPTKIRLYTKYNCN
ncbi:LacI family DNA-binding transcriptional regulator [Acidisoma cladoniae]|uniref:LacI family DNA-binding transcriptional regulator n=1 Tax=Acidisoma cladoniae TaxID=3040935 RepID=UPI00254A5B9A|nr:LacI family DNA-binding transcriptional regulator [Acidisoma sp. PAMC 29798]